MTWLGIKAKHSLSCRYETELVCVIDKANIAKGIYWMCKAIYSFVNFSQAGETFERPNTKNKFHDSETEEVQISHFKNYSGDLKCSLQELELLSQSSLCGSRGGPRAQELLSWKVPCPGHRRWSREAAAARNQEDVFGNIVGKHFEKGQLDSEQTDRDRAVMARERPWWHRKTLGKKSCRGIRAVLG